MTPREFIENWKPVALTERAAAHSHFLDLCRLLGHKDPVADAHRDLDAAVAAAYRWPADITQDDALARLLALDLARANAGPREPARSITSAARSA